MTEHAPTRRAVDPRTAAIAGLSTLAWYAVPDVVGPRWARALAKTAVATAGVALTLTSTDEGEQAREGVRSLREAVRAAGGGTTGADVGTGVDGAPIGDRADAATSAVAGRPEEDDSWAADPEEVAPVPTGVAVAGVATGLALATAAVVAGERWAYRRGERLRARGTRLPHTRVGLVLGALAVALAAAEPLLWNAEER